MTKPAGTILALLLVAAPTWSQEPRPSERRVRLTGSYAHPFFAFKIRLADGWTRGPAHGRAHASFYGPKSESVVPRIDLYIHRPRSDFLTFVGRFKAEFAEGYPDLKVIVDELRAADGPPHFHMVAAFTDGGVPMRSIWTGLGAGDRVYMLGWAVPAGSFDRTARPIEAMMRSLRTYDEPKAPLETRKAFEKTYGEGEEAYRKGDHAVAAARFRDCARLLPEFPDVWSALGRAALRTNDFITAEEAFRKAHELDPADSEYAFALGTVLLRQTKLEAAVRALLKAVEIDPEMDRAWANLGSAQLALDRPGDAAKALETAVRLDPESAFAQYHLGLALERLGRTDEALTRFREALKLDPDHDGAREGVKRLAKK